MLREVFPPVLMFPRVLRFSPGTPVFPRHSSSLLDTPVCPTGLRFLPLAKKQFHLLWFELELEQQLYPVDFTETYIK